jgi:RNA ligase (TIGR02306 family)
MENLNSCCFVAKVKEINSIPGAYNIELAIIEGWNCIVKKNSHKVGDLVIVVTTDAVISQKLSDELGVTNYLRKGQRVRTVKLQGVYSECLIIPVSFIPEKYKKEGIDCMELLEIFKYEPPIKMVQLSSGRKIKYKDNPNFGIYYKFPNAKNVPNMFSSDDLIEVTRKIHGTNARYGIVKKSKLSIWDKIKKLFGKEWIDYEFVVGSHNVEKGSESQGFYDTNVWYEINDRYKIKDKLWSYVKRYYTPQNLGSGFILYGEIYGEGIQKGYDYGIKGTKFIGFDICVNGEYYSANEAFFTISISMDLDYVDILYWGCYDKDAIDVHVYNNYINETKVPHEGVVVKHSSGQRNKIFKVINPEYLLWNEKHELDEKSNYNH